MAGKFMIMAGWDDVPHLSEEQKAEELKNIPPYQRDARAKGIPQLGAGAIYPVNESEIIVEPFRIPDHFRQAYGMDVGWNRTAVVWGALDGDSDVLYLYSEHYRGQADPPVHAAAVRARGTWIPGVIDPAARGRGQRDGERLLKDFVDLGLETLTTAFNGVEAGIYEVWMRIATGRLKVFKTLLNWREEYRFYQRDEKGRIKEGLADHLMDGTRYLVVSGLDRAIVRPAEMWGIANRGGSIQSDYNPFAGEWDAKK